MDLFVNAVIVGLGLMAATMILPFIVMGVAAIFGLFAIIYEKIKGN